MLNEKRNEVKFNKIKHTKNEIRASKDSSQSEPDPRFLTCEEEVTPVWLPHAAHDAKCARSTWQGLSSQTQPTVSAQGGHDVTEGADGAQSLCCRHAGNPSPLASLRGSIWKAGLTCRAA